MALKVKASSIKYWNGSSWVNLPNGKAVSVGWNSKVWYDFSPATLRAIRYDFNGTRHGYTAGGILSGSTIGNTSSYVWARTDTGLAHATSLNPPLPEERVPAGTYRIRARIRITKQGSDPNEKPVELSWGHRNSDEKVIGTYMTKGWGTHSYNFTETVTWPFQPKFYISGGSLYDTVTTHEIHVDWVSLESTSGAQQYYLLNNHFHVWDGAKWLVL